MGVLRREVEENQAQRFKDAAKRGQIVDNVAKVVVLSILFVGVLVFLLPLYVMIVIAIKTPTEFGTTDIWAWPKNPTLNNFWLVLINPQVSFAQLAKNTTIITLISTLGVLASSAAVAYGFARLNFAGKDRLFLVLLATMMLPGIVTMIPTYVMYANMGWVDTWLPLTVPAWFGGGAFNIFLLRQFFMTVPRDMDEAAILDGANHWIIFSQIMVPLSGPALATVGVFTFIGGWKDFMGPLLYLNDTKKMTLEVGLQAYNSFQSENYTLLMAASTLVMIPIILMFFLGQRWFVKGIVMTGIK